MADRMYRVAAVGVLDLLRVEVTLYDLADGHVEQLASAEVYVQHEQGDDFLEDVRAIAEGLRRIAGAPEPS